MFFVSEKEKIEDLSRTLKAIFGDGKKADGTTEVKSSGQKELRIPEGFTPLPAKKTILIDLDSINNQADIDRIFKR